MLGYLTGIRFFFALVFVLTGSQKFFRLTEFELVLVQLFGTRPFARLHITSRTAAIMVSSFELLLGFAIAFGIFMRVTGVVLILTMVAFTAAVGRAWALHVSCGCFPGRRPSEVSSVVRSGILLALACLLAAFGAPSPFGGAEIELAAPWAAGIAASLYVIVKIVRWGVARNYPANEPKRMVPRAIVTEVLTRRGIPIPVIPGDAADSVEAVPLCRTTGMSISTLFLELEEYVRKQGLPASVEIPGGLCETAR
jgi:uncharacterized membrane protein YphA (DoxX/SURF4 family)